MLARNWHKMIKQGRKWEGAREFPQTDCLLIGDCLSDTEPLIEISLPSNFRFFYIKQAPNHSKPSTKICEMC